MYQFEWLSERGGNFLNLHKKEGSTQKGGGGGFPQKRGRETNPERNYVIALLTKEKQLRMNRKTMTLTFFELYAVYIKKVQNPFSKVIKF